MPLIAELTVSDFQDAASKLQAFAANTGIRTSNMAVATAVLMNRSTNTREGLIGGPNGTVANTALLQHEICDRTWQKLPYFLPSDADGPVYKPFTNSFKPTTNNNWRNSLDLQAGLGCDAPPTVQYLGSPSYISERRVECEFRNAATGACTSPSGHASGARTCFNPSKGGEVPGVDTTVLPSPKLLGRAFDGRTRGYWALEPTPEVLADLLGDPRIRVPATTFATALYAGSAFINQTGNYEIVARLQQDLALDDERFWTLFAPTAEITLGKSKSVSDSQAIQRRDTSIVGQSLSIDESPVRNSRQAQFLPTPVQFKHHDPSSLRVVAMASSDPERRRILLERATQGHQRTLNTLAKHLEAGGYGLKEQAGGFDLAAAREDHRVVFEVKTWTESNLGHQTRAGWAQLLEYQARNASFWTESDVKLALVFDHCPPDELWTWKWIKDEFGIFMGWIESETLYWHQDVSPLKPPRAPIASSTVAI